MLLSHADSDHAGGVELLAEKFPGMRVIAPGQSEKLHNMADSCQRGMSWIWDDAISIPLKFSESV